MYIITQDKQMAINADNIESIKITEQSSYYTNIYSYSKSGNVYCLGQYNRDVANEVFNKLITAVIHNRESYLMPPKRG
jgi:hypothetical protein